MTTIAFDGKTLACDSQATGSFVIDHGTKLFKHRGAVYGCSGDLECVAIFKRWIKGDEEFKDRPKFDECEFGALRIEGGKCFHYGKRCVSFEVRAPYAMGSGQDFAMGAMLAGATAEKAVEIASQLDEGTGGKIHTLTANKN